MGLHPYCILNAPLSPHGPPPSQLDDVLSACVHITACECIAWALRLKTIEVWRVSSHEVQQCISVGNRWLSLILTFGHFCGFWGDVSNRESLNECFLSVAVSQFIMCVWYCLVCESWGTLCDCVEEAKPEVSSGLFMGQHLSCAAFSKRFDRSIVIHSGFSS